MLPYVHARTTSERPFSSLAWAETTECTFLVAFRCRGCGAFRGGLTAWEGDHVGSRNRNALIYTYLEEEQISLRVSDVALVALAYILHEPCCCSTALVCLFIVAVPAAYLLPPVRSLTSLAD